MKENNQITADEIAKQLDCDVRTVKRDIKKMKGVLIDRVGNNRSGHWVVLSDEEPEQEPISDYVMSDFDFLEESFEADKTIVDIPQPKSDDELSELELLRRENIRLKKKLEEQERIALLLKKVQEFERM